MNRSWKWVAAGLAVLLAASPGWGVPVIGHDAIAVAAKSQPLGVRATVRDAAARVESVSLFYAASRGMTPFRVSMSRSGAGMWYGTIPGHMIGPGAAAGVWSRTRISGATSICVSRARMR